jgi:hypothetical protein
MCATEQNGSIVGLRPDEPAALQPLGKQAEAISIPPQKLYDIASASAANGDRLRRCGIYTFGLRNDLSSESILSSHLTDGITAVRFNAAGWAASDCNAVA